MTHGVDDDDSLRGGTGAGRWRPAHLAEDDTHNEAGHDTGHDIGHDAGAGQATATASARAPSRAPPRRATS